MHLRQLVEFEVKCCVVISVFGLVRWQPSLEEKQEATAARKNILSFSIIAAPTLRPTWGGLELIPALCGQRWAHTQGDSSQGHVGRQASVLILTHTYRLFPICLLRVSFWAVGGSLSTRRESTQTGGTCKLQTERARARGSNPRL